MNLSDITKKKKLVADPPATGIGSVQTSIAPPVVTNLDYVENTSLLSAHQNLLQLISDVKSKVSNESIASSPSLASRGVTSISAASLDSLIVSDCSLWAQASSEYEAAAWDRGTSVMDMMYAGIQSVERDIIQSHDYLYSLGPDAASWIITPEVRRIFQRRVDFAGSFLSRLVSGAVNSVWNSAGDCFLSQMARLIDCLAEGVNVQEVNRIIADLRSKPGVYSSQEATLQAEGIATMAALSAPMNAASIAYSLSAASVVLKASSRPKERKWKAIGDEIRRLTLSLLVGESLDILNSLASAIYDKVSSPILRIGTSIMSANLLGECPVFDGLISAISNSVSELETDLIYKMYVWENELERKYGMLDSMTDMSVSRVSDINQINILSRIAEVLPSIEISKGASWIMRNLSSRI